MFFSPNSKFECSLFDSLSMMVSLWQVSSPFYLPFTGFNDVDCNVFDAGSYLKPCQLNSVHIISSLLIFWLTAKRFSFFLFFGRGGGFGGKMKFV